MTKNQKMLLGVAILGVGGYLYWNSTKSKNFAGFVKNIGCPCKETKGDILTTSNGTCIVQCKGNQYCSVPCPTPQ